MKPEKLDELDVMKFALELSALDNAIQRIKTAELEKALMEMRLKQTEAQIRSKYEMSEKDKFEIPSGNIKRVE